MASNQLIGKCLMCGQDYCCECSDHDGWAYFCCEECDRDWHALPENKGREPEE